MMPVRGEGDLSEVRWMVRDWQKESLAPFVSVAEVLIDPLSSKVKKLTSKAVLAPQTSSDNTPKFVDPLGAANDGETDTGFLNVEEKPKDAKKEPVLPNTLATTSEDYLVKETHLPGFESWSSKRKVILERFMASEKLSIKTNYLPNGIPIETQLSIVNRQLQRVQQFEDSSGQKKFANLSQEEYVRVLNELRRKLLVAWSAGKRVQSIEISVDLARILASTSSPQFYPSQFVLVTDILDMFGELVYERLLKKANEERKKCGLDVLPPCFSLEEVPPDTQLTARNWFCKIAAITELLPRFYVETSLINCMLFMDPDALTANFCRLCEMINCLPHPLVATYARAYLCRIIMRVTPNDQVSHWKCLNDWINLSDAVPQTGLLTPALEWIIQCAAYYAISYNDMLPVWNFCRLSEKRSLLLRPFISSVTPRYLCEHAMEFCNLVLQDDQALAEEITMFGEHLLKDVTPDSVRPSLLRAVWQRILAFLQQIEQYADSVVRFVEALVRTRTDVIELLSSEQFAQMLDLVREENLKAKCSQLILRAFIKAHSMSCCRNFRIAYMVLSLCKRLQDSVPVSVDDSEVKTVANLISKSLDRFELNHEPESALNFYVDARAALSNNDAILTYLVTRICVLGYTVVQMKRMSRAGALFLRACVASAFITIPSIPDPVQSIYLYLRCGTLGLMANFLPQVDAIVRCCIELLAVSFEIPPAKFYTVASAFLAFLTLVPDSPKKKPLYTFDAFLTAINSYSWDGHVLEHGRLLMQCLNYCSTMRLAVFPYHISKVQSNDAIYGCSEKFSVAIKNEENVIVEELCNVLENCSPKAPVLSLELLELIASIGDCSQLAPFIVHLWEIVVKKKDLARRRSSIYDELKSFTVDDKALKRLLKAIATLERESLSITT